MHHTTVDEVVSSLGIQPAHFRSRLEQLAADTVRFRRLWAYYANPMRNVGDVTDDSERPYRLAQEWGLPTRITGYRPAADPLADGQVTDRERKEVVVQNDIAWRIDTMIDYLFGKMPQVRALAASPRREEIERLLRLILEDAGGISFLQQLALVGSIYGFADVAVTWNADARPDAAAGDVISADAGTPIGEKARSVSLQITQPQRSFALKDPEDLTRTLAYVHVHDLPNPEAQSGGPVQRFIGRLTGSAESASVQQIEIWSDSSWWRFLDGKLIASGGNSVQRLPVVHVQNSAVPFGHSGASDVEPLIPLQDELNIRLSDRAHRIAMQSFKMYLGKGIDNFEQNRPAPGQVWATDNGQADIKEIGGDARCDSEDLHIAEVREAMDRISGVPPVAAGAIRNRIGNLTSAAALRVTLMSLLARTERKRALYGDALLLICVRALEWLNVSGVFPTTPEERRLELQWGSPLPENDVEKLEEARLKLDLGVAKEVVLRELGY